MVGPQDELDQSELESALTDSISSGRLQELVDENNPDSSLRVMDNVQDDTPSTEEPPEVDSPPDNSPPDNSTNDHHGLSAGATAGVVVAGVATVALAVGLVYGRRRVLKKREESKLQLQAMKQGSIINMELLDTGLDHDLDDLEKGNGGGGILAESDTMDHRRQSSYRLDQVGVDMYENDALPPPPSTDPSFIILPFAGKRPQSTKEPSEGDLVASNNHADSYNSSMAFAVADRNASSGSIGIMTPVNYSSAMGLDVASSDDSSCATSSSEESDSDETDDGTHHSSESSEYDEHGIMKTSALVARTTKYRNSMQARALEENIVAPSVPPEPSKAVIIAGAMLGTAAMGGAAVYAATREKDEPREERTLDASQHSNVLPPPPPPRLRLRLRLRIPGQLALWRKLNWHMRGLLV